MSTTMDLGKVLEKCADLDEEFKFYFVGGKQVKAKIFKQKIEMMVFIFQETLVVGNWVGVKEVIGNKSTSFMIVSAAPSIVPGTQETLNKYFMSEQMKNDLKFHPEHQWRVVSFIQIGQTGKSSRGWEWCWDVVLQLILCQHDYAKEHPDSW